MNGMYKGTVIMYFYTAGFLGLYLGQVVFRARGLGRLTPDAYTSKAGVMHQLASAVVAVGLNAMPPLILALFNLKSLNLWVVAVFFCATVAIVCNFTITYFVPKLSKKLA